MSNLLTPVVKGRFLSTIPSGFQRILEHFVGCIDANDFETFFQQHHGVKAGTAGDIQYSMTFLLSQQAYQEVPIILRTLFLVADHDLPNLCRFAVRILILGWCIEGTGTKHRIHHGGMRPKNYGSTRILPGSIIVKTKIVLKRISELLKKELYTLYYHFTFVVPITISQSCT